MLKSCSTVQPDRMATEYTPKLQDILKTHTTVDSGGTKKAAHWATQNYLNHAFKTGTCLKTHL